ncbi:DUF4169 domain-containing protein [Sphingomonas sp. Sph1(2015)]|jgi:hypothetical protein|uniref:DUF4169 family protein n=1 Tax=Sphingomonas sp. Sph1(2015) TaxID=1628084 RepID=UPI0009758F87|nr:DUF4169 family protein [Sphingomonas sp. Sph1(2015)]OMJ30797.1 DUF4169 domain-containing protein [Sphingomonas sp. Sph1(2015)]
MGEVVNFRQARKGLARKQAEQQAAENRARFGRSKAEKQRDAAEQERIRKKLDGAKRED